MISNINKHKLKLEADEFRNIKRAERINIEEYTISILKDFVNENILNVEGNIAKNIKPFDVEHWFNEKHSSIRGLK